MLDPDTYRISSESAQTIIGVMDAIMPQLPRDKRRQLNKVIMNYWQLYGIGGLYERVNNRTVSEILAACPPEDDLKPSVSGELDGLRYELYETPPDRRQSEPPKESEGAVRDF